MAITETSNKTEQSAVQGTNTAQGDGIWGQCDAGRGVVGVSRGGAGVWGHTINGRGVVGVNNEEGTGVWGETKKGRGIVGIVQTDGDGAWGECNAGRGVVGVSKTGAGVWGHTINGRGVVGVNNEEGTGVWGETKKGRGVVGISQQDIGVFGKGGRLAGFFEGNVEVSGSLLVGGLNLASLLQRIQQLEQQVADLSRKATSSGGGGTSTPNISVSQGGSSGQNLKSFNISGSGFSNNENVTIQVVSRSKFGEPSSSSTPTFADSAGHISHAISLFCDGGMVHEFTAVSANGRSSNTAASSC